MPKEPLHLFCGRFNNYYIVPAHKRNVKRNIAILTGGRAEYGLLKPLLRAISQHPKLELQLLVTGMHLSPEHGLTVTNIRNDNIKIAAEVEILLASDTGIGMAKSMGLGLIGFADAYKNLRPDFLVILGDRYEALAASAAAVCINLPIIHLHGGELTHGAIDDSFRHAITKFASYHFPAHDLYRRRIVQMGEDPARVNCMGALIEDVIAETKFLDRKAIEESIGIPSTGSILLVTLHPATAEGVNKASQDAKALISALDRLPKEANLVFTKANSDPGGRVINAIIEQYVQQRQKNAFVYDALGSHLYLSVMKNAVGVVGNSSSGVIEAPLLGIGSVNIGTRQEGRLKISSVIDCSPEPEIIYTSIMKLMNNPTKPQPQRLGQGVAARMAEFLANIDMDNAYKPAFQDIKMPGV